MANTVVPKGKNLPAGWLKNPAQLDPSGVDAARTEMLTSKETFVSRTGREITPSFKDVKGASAVASAPTPAARESFVISADFADESNPAAAAAAQPSVSTRPVAQPQRVASNQPIPLQREYECINDAKVGTIESWMNPDNSWTGVISYSNGAGTERFDAPTLRALSVKLLQGKAHATTFVREANASKKLGRQLQTWGDWFGLARISQADFMSMTPPAKKAVVEAFQDKEIERFNVAHPNEVYPCEKNNLAIISLSNEMKVPITLHNLEILVDNLRSQGRLELFPEVQQHEPQPQPQARPTTVAAETAAQVATTIEATSPRKRGQRFQSALIPGQSSNAEGSSNLYPDGRPKAALNQDQDSVARAKELSKTPEGLAQLRREVTPAMQPGFKGRRQ